MDLAKFCYKFPGDHSYIAQKNWKITLGGTIKACTMLLATQNSFGDTAIQMRKYSLEHGAYQDHIYIYNQMSIVHQNAFQLCI